MATGTAPRGPQATPPANKAEGRWLEYDQFIDAQLRKARGHVKGVELAGALMGLAAGGLLYFLLVSVLDHWLVGGGLGFWGRLACLAVFLGGAGWFVVRRLGPLLIRRINPVYAAETIEKSKPSLKNALINFLFLRGDRSGVPQVVFQAVEEQAASSLQRTPVEATVDRTTVIQIGYVLLAIVAIFAAYKLFSPKDPLETFQRVVMPWADIQAPTRVTIVDVSPGDSTKYLGEAVEVTAEVRGVGADEPVRILYTTADQGTVDQAVVMYRAADSFRHTGKIPSGEAGLQQDIAYRIEAGDAVSPTYHLKAAAAPTIAVESIDYEFPAYMERAKAHIENTGDIQAYEGTSVTIHGRANQPLKSAQLVLDGGENRHQEIALAPMKSDGRNVAAKFTLELNDGDHSPEFSRYQLRPEGRAKPEPAQYKIDVFADLPPEIKFLAPEKDEMTVPSNGSVQLELRAHDPDFALSEVTLSANVDDKQIVNKKLLSERHSGPLLSKFRFQPAKLGLKEGDTVSYWAAAKDNRTPIANEAHTPHRLIRIVKAEQRRASNEPAANDANENPDPNPNPNDDNAKPKDDEHPNHNPKDANDNPTPDAQNPNNPDNKQNDKQDNRQENSGRDNRPKDQSNDGNQSKDDKHDQSKSAGEQKGPKSSGGSGSEKNQKSNGSDSGGEAKQDAGKSGDSSKGGSSQAGKSGGNSAKGNQPNDKQPADQKGDPSGGGRSNGAQQNSAQPNGKQSSDPSRGNPSDASQPKSGQNGDQQAKGQPQSDSSDAGKSADGSEGSKQQSQDNPSNIAKTAEALRQALAQQQQNSGGNSGQQSDKPSGQSAGKQSGQSGTDGQSKNSGGTGDQASDGASKNPSTNPQGSGGPAPNGKPGTGGMKGNQKPSGANQKAGDKQNGPQNSPDQKSGPQPNGDQKAPGEKSGESGDRKNDGQQGTSPQQPGTNPNRDGTKSDKSPGDKNSSDQPHSGSQSQPGDKSQPNGQSRSPDKSQPGNPSQPGDKTQDKSSDGNKSQSGNPSDQAAPSRRQKPDNSPQPGDASKPGDKAEKNGAGQPPSPDKRNSNGENGENKAGQSDPSKQGDGAQAKQGSQPSDQKRDQTENGSQQQPDAKGGDPERAKGKSGSGQQDNDKSGSASPQEGNKPNEHKDDSNGDQSPKESNPGDNAKSPSNSSKESNSKGSEGGDKSGGGKPGPGQSANQAGTGGAGQNTAADEGKGKAEGTGKGEDSSKPGTDKQSDKATGQSGNQAGNGSGTSDKPANDGARSSKSGDKSQGGSGTEGPGGNRIGELPDGAAPDTSPVNGDAANMDFARKQFDLALDRLKKGNPDLLKELNWSADDAQKLADRLDQMKSAAKTAGPEGDRARQQMDELLRNLGSRAGQLSRGGDRTANDAQRGVRESNDSGPPAEYQDLFNAFQQGVARGAK